MRLMLRALRLPAIAAVYEDLAIKAAKANLTHEEFLFELLRAECLQRDEHRVARLLRLSGLPPDKTFGTLQLDQFPPLIRQQLERLRSGAFLDDAINVVAAGKPGVGKSHALRIDRKLTHHSGASGPPVPPCINAARYDEAAA